jgi:hypothetical protein
MSEKLRETVSRLRQVAEALASHFAWESSNIYGVDGATEAELTIKNEEGVVVWRRSMKVSEL